MKINICVGFSFNLSMTSLFLKSILIVTCDFIGRRLVSPTSCIFMKTRVCQSNCPRYVWRVTEESTVVADDYVSSERQGLHYGKITIDKIFKLKVDD